MKVNFTKKEYQVLLTALYISDYIMHGYETERDPETQKYRDLEQKMLSFAKDFGMDECVVWDARVGEYFHSQEFEDEAMEFVERYEEDSFWDELVDRLAKRDFLKKYGEEAILKMSLEERFEKLGEIEDRYDKEFEENSLENLRIGRSN